MKCRSILIILLIAVLCFSQDVSRLHCLWQVSDRSHKIWLIGSIHLLKKDHYPLDPIFDQVFHDAQHIVFEVHPDSLLDPKAALVMMHSGLCDSGTTLQTLISPVTFQLVRQKAESMGLTMTGLEQFKPWYIANLLTAYKMSALGFEPQYGIEYYFIAKSAGTGKTLSGLESIRFQIDLFSTMTDTLQDSLLLQTIQDLDMAEEEIDHIATAWQHGDLTTLQKELLDNFQEYPRLYEKLILSRNLNWFGQIESLLKQDTSCLVIVGTGHLIGTNGLVELFKAKNYTVQQF
jgi:uncharacterized protein